MPELPEVETIRRQLEKEIKGYTLTDVSTTWEKSFRPSFEMVKKAVVGRKIEKVDRQAKLIIFNLADSVKRKAFSVRRVYLLFHLKLTGRLLVRKPSDPKDDYTRSVFTLVSPPPRLRESELRPQGRLPESSRRLELRFADARKFGFVKLVKDKEEMGALLKGYGPEPFKDLTLKKFTEALTSTSRPIKTVFLDQEKISGLGNIYANDALWLAKIHPRRASNKVIETERKKLYRAVLTVLKRGLKYGGASDQWYRQVHGEEGKYQEHFLVYGRTGEKCFRCKKGEIKRIEIGGRGTFICPVCQKEKRGERVKPSPRGVRSVHL